MALSESTDLCGDLPASESPRFGFAKPRQIVNQVQHFFPENFKRRFPVETFPRTVIQKRLNRGNVGFRNRSEVEALRVKEANHIVREALNKLARAGSVIFFVRQKNGKQWNTVCISCFSFCVDGEKDPLSSRRRFIQSFLSILVCSPLPRFMRLGKVDKRM